VNSYIETNIPYITFSEFTPNPLYEDICKGTNLFNLEKCDTIVAVGGGSAIDVAKCIKLFCRMDSKNNYISQEYKDSGVPLIAVPTTAGTGSESTRYSVIYYNGEKQSVTHNSIIPDYAILDSSVLKSLPIYQKKCTLLDALCQGIESWWSVNSNEESKLYSKIAVETIINHMDSYIYDNDEAAAGQIMLAANYAGRAINITQTTAAHAMSYKLTSMYDLPHGHAVALCLPHVWKHMINNSAKCIDPRGERHLMDVFKEISNSLGAKDPEGAVYLFEEILIGLEIDRPNTDNFEDIRILSESVNITRLKNNPVYLSEEAIQFMYEAIVKIKKEV
jgi:alcohol dehydrogenase class IV